MRCKDVVNTMEVGNEAISSICLSLEMKTSFMFPREVKSRALMSIWPSLGSRWRLMNIIRMR
uniref:Uncharacterized protein n=1 Tax=Cannabis sativa TaxID=3483 RepID=A0A803QVA7_CANSA